MHIHIGIMTGLVGFLHVILFGTLWRIVALKLADTYVGQAMALMY